MNQHDLNGKEQVQAMTTLCNSDQKAPASASWPHQLVGFKPGDNVLVQCGRHFIRGTVATLRPPAGLEVTTPSGKVITCDVKAARRI